MTIRPAHLADMDDIVTLLHTYMNPKISPERWRGLFHYSWLDKIPDFGRVAIANGRIVGYLGAVYADRIIEGERVRIVNPNSWYMEKPARREVKGLAPGLGLEMLYDLTRNPDQHYHTNTSSRLTLVLLRRAGFKVMDQEKYVWRMSAPDKVIPSIEVLTHSPDIALHVTDEQRRIMADHEGLPVAPILARDSKQQLFMMVATSIKGNEETWIDVMHADDPHLLGKWGQTLAGHLLGESSSRFSCDSRFCTGKPDGAELHTIDVARYAKTTGLDHRYFDHLYGEIQLLRLKLS